MTDGERTTVLLGAGASAEAGVPMSTGLTKVIAESVSRRRVGGGTALDGTGQALNAAIGALIAHDTARGASAYDGIDVERLFSAVQMLADRDNLEITPFVSRWIPGLDAIGMSGTPLSPFFQREFMRALDGSNTGFQHFFQDSVRAAIKDKGDATDVFRALEQEMIGALRNCLMFDPANTVYLDPLLRVAGTDPIRIATLNYDTTIEAAAQRQGIDVDTGVEAWEGGFDWQWRDGARVRLLKLHGSINWVKRGKTGREPFPDPGYGVVPDDQPQRIGANRLGVVFGQRGKVRADGPFLAMLAELGNFLEATDRLCVFGYSFRDDHINEVIAHWLRTSTDPRITIVDPFLADIRRWQGNDFLNRSMRHFVGERGSSGWTVKEQHQLLKAGTSETLASWA